ncbi:MAG: winged helix-turn-helix domain-containing protein [Bacilli bacterium]|nr:winged helix-turn-helix domain-containing protein [Bacilli bacterium]
MEVSKNGEAINLSSLELKILALLFNNMNKVVTRQLIIERIWEWTGNDVYDNTVTVYMKRIREKLASDIIITLKGVGYRIDEK